jgi:hypothetical protein
LQVAGCWLLVAPLKRDFAALNWVMGAGGPAKAGFRCAQLGNGCWVRDAAFQLVVLPGRDLIAQTPDRVRPPPAGAGSQQGDVVSAKGELKGDYNYFLWI